MEKNKKFLLLLFFISAFLSVSGFVYATEISYPPILGLSINDTSTFPEYVKYFFTFGIGISITLAGLVIMFGGIYYLISLGRGKFTDEGKEWIKAGILGLVLIFGAYLIVYTINPNLTILKMNSLSQIPFDPLNPSSPTPGQKTTTYNEIPIGSLTEKLLTKQIGCYAFDANGDPIKGKRIQAVPIPPNANGEADWIDAPTVVKNDRLDCAIKLEAGIRAKLKKIKDEIIDPLIALMNSKCNCSGATPTPSATSSVFSTEVWSAGLIAAKTTTPTDPTKCGADCDVNKPCDEYKGECDENTQSTNDNCTGSCKSEDGNKKGCKPPGSKDILCCQNPEETKKYIEEVINNLKPNPQQDTEKNYTFENDDGYITVIDEGKWKEMGTVGQFYFLLDKMDSLKQSIKDDSQLLGSYASQLDKCYFSTSSVDLMNMIKQTNQQDNLILVNGERKEKYCKTFNYSNSSCYKNCQEICPDNQSLISCTSNCPQCTDNAADCLVKQEKCLGDCLGKKDCPNSPFSNFSECMGSCNDQCQQNCQKIYPAKSDEFTICQNQCGNNSKCLSENTANCLFSPQEINKCADTIQNRDAENLDYCISRSYSLCKYGSSQNAGYADCVNGYGCAETKGTYPPFFKSDLFSASYIFQNSEKERCQDNFAQCFIDKNVTQTCPKVYPETTKCPSLSKCPYCPCTSIENETLYFQPLPATPSRCSEGGGTYNFSTTGFQIVGAECGEYALNGDPLTFYCQTSWWNNDKEKRETPMGKARFCSKDSEIPVGQTIDDAQKWADAFTQKIDDFMELIASEVTGPIQKLKDHVSNQDYCRCDSKMNKDTCGDESAGQEPACSVDCKFEKTPKKDASGNATEGYDCACTLDPCKGQPCQQMLDLLTKISNAYNKLTEPYGELWDFYINDQRSDVLKELTYSREKTNNCSVQKNSYGEQVKLMDCGRIEDELIPPMNNATSTIINGKEIKNYCYGKKLGELFNTNLNDNWFCCQMYNQE